MAKGLTFYQSATIMNAILSQVTGTSQIQAVDESSFVAQATLALKSGYDPVISAISQVLASTIFSVRPYSRKFKAMYADSQRFGNHVRKLTAIDQDFVEDDRVKLTDGYSTDQYIVRKPKVLQTNWYGQNVISDYITIFKDQLDTAFSSSGEFGQFISMVLQNISDKIEQMHETTSRMTIANMIAAKLQADSSNCKYLLDEYYEETGIALSASTVLVPENFEPFSKWLFAYMQTLSKSMTERSALYHVNPVISGNTVNIMRHTPIDKQKAYFFAPIMDKISTEVKSSVYNEQYLKALDHEEVNFWQAITTPAKINVKPNYIGADGVEVSEPQTVELDNIFGIILDEEAVGYTTINNSLDATPYNARGKYTNYWWHFTDRPWNDMTENSVVLILDTATTYDLAKTGSHCTTTITRKGQPVSTGENTIKLGDVLHVNVVAASGYKVTAVTVNSAEATLDEDGNVLLNGSQNIVVTADTTIAVTTANV